MTTRIVGIEEWELRWLYNEKGMSMQEISDYYNVGSTTIESRMKEYDIKRRSHIEAGLLYDAGKKRTYNINTSFFKAWTPESAWMYGWALGDGNYISENALRFGLARVDKDVLNKFKMVLESEHIIYDYDVWNKDYHKYSKMTRIDFCSKELVDDLRELTLYVVPEKYFSHFIRGFFEAEGSVSWNKHKRNIKCGSIRSNISQDSEDIIMFIQWCLQEFGIIEGGSIYSYERRWQLTFSINDSISLYHYMYDNCGDMFLKRKKEKFEELIERTLK